MTNTSTVAAQSVAMRDCFDFCHQESWVAYLYYSNLALIGSCRRTTRLTTKRVLLVILYYRCKLISCNKQLFLLQYRVDLSSFYWDLLETTTCFFSLSGSQFFSFNYYGVKRGSEFSVSYIQDKACLGTFLLSIYRHRYPHFTNFVYPSID